MVTSETSRAWLLVLTMLAAVLMVALSPVTYTGSDPRGTLLLSHSIITQGTLELDHYGSDVLDRYGAVIQEKKRAPVLLLSDGHCAGQCTSGGCRRSARR